MAFFFFLNLLGCFSQEIKHFPGRSESCGKYLLARNMSRVVKLFPKEFNLFLGVFLQSEPFLKPDFPLGTIIFLALRCKFITRSAEAIKPGQDLMRQRYVSRVNPSIPCSRSAALSLSWWFNTPFSLDSSLSKESIAVKSKTSTLLVIL